MSRGGTKERKILGAAKGSTPFRVESIDDGGSSVALPSKKLQEVRFNVRTRKFVRS